ncbi:hypothetical protein X471_00039 [Bartonella bacilliformis str. Heidi Mejia]|nr:hypothetical protein X471_00039 [Bartonella bacilliformis str. Heidi Mejia]
MNMRKKMYKRSCSFVSAFVALGMFSQQVLAKTPADTLVMAWNLDGISTFDPAQINDSYSNEIILNVCSRLIDHAQNDATKMMPNLAKSWDVSGDHNTTVITFHLKWALCVLSERCQCDSHVSVCIMPMIYGFSWDL